MGEYHKDIGGLLKVRWECEVASISYEADDHPYRQWQ